MREILPVMALKISETALISSTVKHLNSYLKKENLPDSVLLSVFRFRYDFRVSEISETLNLPRSRKVLNP